MLMVVVLVIIAAIAIVIAPVFGGLGIDAGLFNQEGCKPPCWHGLTPGQSTSGDVDDFLANLSENQWPERDIRVYDTGCTSIRLVDNFGTGIVDLYVVDGKLTFVDSSHPNKARLGEIVDHFGDPEYFEAVLFIGIDTEVYILEVNYPQKGLGFEIRPDQENDVGQIRADMEVDTIQYFEPGDLSNYLLNRYFCSLTKTDAILRGQTEIKNFIQEWPGFGKIDIIIDDPSQNE
jgi:hypothetical protein